MIKIGDENCYLHQAKIHFYAEKGGAPQNQQKIQPSPIQLKEYVK